MNAPKPMNALFEGEGLRWAGIGWAGIGETEIRETGIQGPEAGYRLVVTDDDGVRVESRRWRPHRIDGLLACLKYWQRRSERLVCVIDSTTGTLERRLVEAGFEVRRADPRVAGPRSVQGSADPARLAEAARLAGGRLPLLTLSDGGLVGREPEIESAQREADEFFSFPEAGEGPVLALTFDDGPDPVHTPAVLDVLAARGVPATFFCVGLAATAFPDLLRRIHQEGHAVANHTWSHPYLPDLTRAEIDQQVESTLDAVTRAGVPAPRLFRPPYGGRDRAVVRRLTDLGLTTVLWDVEAADWTGAGPDMIEADVVRGVRPGSVVLLHDGGGDRSATVAALPRILDRLEALGYRFVALDPA
jgi:peptidoglycan/xylan/chitin deacetylase (PgdA/CDA1 family)